MKISMEAEGAIQSENEGRHVAAASFRLPASVCRDTPWRCHFPSHGRELFLLRVRDAFRRRNGIPYVVRIDLATSAWATANRGERNESSSPCDRHRRGRWLHRGLKLERERHRLTNVAFSTSTLGTVTVLPVTDGIQVSPSLDLGSQRGVSSRNDEETTESNRGSSQPTTGNGCIFGERVRIKGGLALPLRGGFSPEPR